MPAIQASVTAVTTNDWKVLQVSLNALNLGVPPLEIDGIPGPKTLEAAKKLVPLIEASMKSATQR